MDKIRENETIEIKVKYPKKKIIKKLLAKYGAGNKVSTKIMKAMTLQFIR